MIGSQVSKVWTEETIQQLKTLWDAGLSAAAISEQIPGSTRNAVIGKKNRLGLAFRRPNPSLLGRRKDKSVSKPTLPAAAPKPIPKAPTEPGIPFLKAGSTTCRSVEGYEVNEQGYTLAMFCSNPKDLESSFCPFHQDIYYRKDGR